MASEQVKLGAERIYEARRWLRHFGPVEGWESVRETIEVALLASLDGAPAREAVNAASRQQIAAWFAVCDVLDEVKPGWMRGPDSAKDAAIRTIRALASTGGER